MIINNQTKGIDPQIIVVRDTEYTSWKWAWENNWSEEWQHKELVQIGAVKWNTASQETEDEWMQFFLPRINNKLSGYFCDLTKITQEEIDTKWEDFESGVMKFFYWCWELPLYSWGNDWDILYHNQKLYNTQLNLDKHMFCDMRTSFWVKNISTQGYNSGQIHKYFGLPNQEIEHNALGDAKNICRVLKFL